jgi:LPS export ABC transporter protein LptC
MSRGQARFVVSALVFVLLAVVGHRLVINRQTGDQKIAALTESAPLSATDKWQQMNDFTRVKFRPDGKKAWEIVARKARYSTDNNLVIVETPQFSFYPKDGDAFSLRSREARVLLTSDKDKKEEVMRIELTGDLELQIGDFVITTQEAIFESEQNRISSPSAVQINGPGVAIAGQGYAVDVVNKYMTLEAEVKTELSRSES